MDRFELFAAFIQGTPVTLRSLTCAAYGVHGTGIISSIEREDGSGNCWNVTYTPTGCYEKVVAFIRTK
jgi:hypothetical protein